MVRRAVGLDDTTRKGGELSFFMDSPKVEHGSCRFKAMKGADGKPIIHLELFHNSVKSLEGITIEFELLSGSTVEQAKSLTDAANDRILGVIVSRN